MRRLDCFVAVVIEGRESGINNGKILGIENRKINSIRLCFGCAVVRPLCVRVMGAKAKVGL